MTSTSTNRPEFVGAADPFEARTSPRAADGAPGRGWAVAGVGAGLAGLVGIGASMQVDAVYDPSAEGDAGKIVDRLAEQVPQILVFHTATMIAVALTVVFAAGLQRRLRAQAPAQSLLPTVAASGLGLVTVAGLMGAGLTTEFVFGLAQDEQMVPESAAFFGHWVGTIPWLWMGAGLTGLAVAVAALRHAAAPRWIGWVSVVLGGLTLLFGLSPLQYMAGMVGPLWLLVAAVGFTFGDRARRA
ncbi:hypothetical protein [Angustibacter sp. Root456]|uniref:hypothetical protein n=1 Tax=Angustibacter sp. Root456 TaxID=1736539 RepID=UPI0006F61232|nr:hypothetical protein [Angustibacter sp. Root456]KQX62026.1 hypothetical protein ASD06_16000 [Angustibacter sp. Root456]